MNKWIPVTEKLPEEFERVLVTLKNGFVGEVFYINNKFKFIEGFKEGGLRPVFKDNPVIAWMEMPKAYKEGI